MRNAIMPLAWIAIMVLLWQTGADAPLPALIATLAALGLWFVLVPAWGFIGYGIRNALVVLSVAEALFLIGSSILDSHTPRDGSFGIAPLALVFGFLDARVLFGRARAKDASVELRFPLAGKRFCVVQGGGDVLVNHHARVRAQRHALDIVALGPFGMRASTWNPERNEAFHIFGCPIQAPCDATVAAVRDEMPDDGSLGARGLDVFGNYVVLRRDDGIDVIVAHLQRGSVAVRVGERIACGSILGRVGNSGRSSEPHLHLHAERDGEGVAMRFDGRALARNAIVDARRVAVSA